MRRLIFLLPLLLLLVSACAHWNPDHYRVENLIGVSDQETKLFLVGPLEKATTLEEVKDKLEEVKDKSKDNRFLNSILKDADGETLQQCFLTKEKIPAVLVPIVAAGGKLLWDWYVDKKAQDLQTLKKLSQQSYSRNIIVTKDDLTKCKCAILARYKMKDNHKSTPEIGMVTILRLKPYRGQDDTKNAFTIRPLYARAYNAVALTAKTSKKTETEYPVDISMGLVLKAIGEDSSGLSKVFLVGGQSVSIGNLGVGPEAEARLCPKDSDDCGYESDLIPYVSTNTLVSVTMSVTETGHIGIPFDQRLAELKALKEAIGPALSTAIKSSFDEGD